MSQATASVPNGSLVGVWTDAQEGDTLAVHDPLLDHPTALDLNVEYGPGRHGPGRNLFTYVCDPSSGQRIELFADMAQIPDDTLHQPIRWEAGDRMTKTINRWGPTPPESFLA